MNFTNLTILIFVVLTYATYTWSVFVFFKKNKQDRNEYSLLQVVSLSFWALSIFYLVKEEQFFYSGYFCIVGIVLSQTLFWFSALTIRKKRLTIIFSEDTPLFIINEGPYKYFQHPFYYSYILFYITVSSYIHQPYLYVLGFAVVYSYLRAIRAEAKKFQGSPLADQYLKYKKGTLF